MKRILQVFCVLFSAIILSLGIPNELYNFGSPFLGLISIIPLYYALSNEETFKWSGILTSLHFATVQLLSSFWLGNFRDFAIFTLGGPTLVYIFQGFWLGNLFHLIFVFPEKTNQLQTSYNVPLRIILFAALWTIWEWAKSIGFLAFPWGTVIMSAYKWQLLTQIVDITGTWGISFLFAFFASFAAETLKLLSKKNISSFTAKTFVKCTLFVVILFSSVLIYGAFRLNQNVEPVKNIKIALVQQNADPWESGSEEIGILMSQKLTKDVINQKPDLVCWSEGVLSYPFPLALNYYNNKPKNSPLLPFIKQMDTPFLIGAPHIVNGTFDQFENAAVLFNKDSTVQGYYAKIQLVPFAEYIPFTEYEWFATLLETLVGFSEGWTPGTAYKHFSVPTKKENETVSFSVPICFEDAFPTVCRKLYKSNSEMLVNITNDSWSKTASAEYQHFVISSYRAIELRTTFVRSTNSGFSTIVDPKGNILGSLPIFEATSACFDVPIYPKVQTFYLKFGNWLAYICLVLFCSYYIICSIKQKAGK